jgi:hypothetical protein
MGVTDKAPREDDSTLRRYAAARREALAAAETARGPLSEHTWNEVATAMSRANEQLARCDDAWLELASAGVEMVARRNDLARLTLVWGPSVRAACRYRDPDSDRLARMRARLRDTQLSGWQNRRLDHAARQLRQTVHRAGPAGAASRKQAWRLAERYGRYLRCDELAAHLTRVIDWYDDGPDRADVARRGAQLCLDVGEVECGRRLYEICHATAMRALAGHDDELHRTMAVAGQQHLADYHLLNGAPARAESLVRQALERLPELLSTVSARDEAETLEDLYDRCLGTIADCLLARGQQDAAHAAYVTAYEFADRHTGVEQGAAHRHRNAALYTGRTWPDHD